jgi:hypothetical protein
LEPKESMWCAIVVEAAGINLKEPAEGEYLPRREPRLRGYVPIEDRTTAAVPVLGEPGGIHDGHCINFLRARAAGTL